MTLLTLPMVLAGFVAGACQWTAHQLMRGRAHATPIPRYAVGSGIVFICWGLAIVVDRNQEPIVGLAYIYAASIVATWISYETDPASQQREGAPLDIERWAAAIEAEHRESAPGD